MIRARPLLVLFLLLGAAGWAQDAGPSSPNAEEWANARALIEEASGYLKEVAGETVEADTRCSAKLGAKLEVIGSNLEALGSKFDRALLRKTYALTEDARALLRSDCPASFARRADRRLERVVSRLERADRQLR